MAGLKYWVWLSEVKGLTNRSKLLLLDYFGTPENVYYADEDEYRLVEGIEPRQIALLAEKSLENADRILGACSRLGLRLLTMQDADYPMRLRNIFEPPCLLYVKGQLPVIDEEVAVAMVGTRKASPYGIEAAEKIAYGLCKQGAVVISGAAAGASSGVSVFLPRSTMRRMPYTIADTTAHDTMPRKVLSFPAYSSHTAPIA